MSHPLSMPLKIVWGCEIILSLRALLFCAPYWLNRNLIEQSGVYTDADKTICLVGGVALLYLMLGVTAFRSPIKRIQGMHAAGAIAAVILTVWMKGALTGPVGVVFYGPVCLALLFCGFNLLMNPVRRQPA